MTAGLHNFIVTEMGRLICVLPWEDASCAGLSRFLCTLAKKKKEKEKKLFDLYLFARQNIAPMVFITSEQD